LIISIIFLISQTDISLYGQPLTNTSTVESTQAGQPSQSQLQPFTIPRSSPNEGVTTPSNPITGSASATNNIDDDPNDDIVLLSQRYNEERFGDEIFGEVLNNGSNTAEYVKVSASFYDQSGAIIGSEFTYAEPSTIRPGDRAAFTMYISSEAIEDDTERYEFTIQWNDEDFNEFSNRITGTQVGSNNNNDNDNNDNDNNDNDNNDNDNNDNDVEDTLRDSGIDMDL
jgi:hypothetical protein